MIDIILGPMFAGKSTELQRKITRFRFAGKKCIIIKHQNDTRYTQSCMSTHDLHLLEAISATSLSSITAHGQDYDVIGIDEG